MFDTLKTLCPTWFWRLTVPVKGTHFHSYSSFYIYIYMSSYWNKSVLRHCPAQCCDQIQCHYFTLQPQLRVLSYRFIYALEYYCYKLPCSHWFVAVCHLFICTVATFNFWWHVISSDFQSPPPENNFHSAYRLLMYFHSVFPFDQCHKRKVSDLFTVK